MEELIKLAESQGFLVNGLTISIPGVVNPFVIFRGIENKLFISIEKECYEAKNDNINTILYRHYETKLNDIKYAIKVFKKGG